MKIELTTLKRIAKAVPGLTIAQFVAVWAEKIEDQRRETEKARIAEKRVMPPTPANNEPTSCNIDQQLPTREEQEKSLFIEGRAICGRQAGGMITALLKQNSYDIEAVKKLFAIARAKADPREYIAASIRRQNGHGTGSLAAAADDLIARAEAIEGDQSPVARDDSGVDRD
jgi:hypothetical protein